MPPKIPDVSVIVELIRKGFVAERKFIKAYVDKARQIALTEYQISEGQVNALVNRALKAAIRTVRLHEWQPGLIRRTVQSQATVFRWQQGKITGEDIRKIQGTIEQYVRNHLGQRINGQLNLNQEMVCSETFDIFFQKVKNPEFTLTSNLDTFLIGIAINQIKSFSRRQHRAPVTSPFTVLTKPVDPQDVALLKKIRFYRTSHRLVARQLGLLDDKCLHIILQHYGIDAIRVDAANEAPEPMSEAEFESLFNVTPGSVGESRKLKDIAIDLDINPKKISEKHLECLDKLVQRVIPALLDEPDASFAKTVREEMKTRLAEAQARKQKKQAEKQRYANSR